MTCKLDHNPETAGIPAFLCRACHPELGKGRKQVAGVSHVVEEKRDFRIPKGMSTAEGNAMLASRSAAERQKSAESLAKLKAAHEGEFYDKKLKKWLPLEAKGDPT